MRLKLAIPLLLLVFLWPNAAVSAGTEGSSWTSDNDMLLFYEALTRLQTNRLEPMPSRQVVQQAIRCSVKQLDRFSDYLSPEEYRAYKASLNSRYAGVGMELSVGLSGRIVCIPYPKGPAERAGIGYGDVLIAVNGQSVAGESLFLVGARIRGEAGARVSLTVQKATGPPREIAMVLEPFQFQSVLCDDAGPVPVIRIVRFTAETAQELKDAVLKRVVGRSKVIDLRGNTGGDLFAAVDAAALFLKTGSKIVELKTRQGNQAYWARRDPLDEKSPLFLWQDDQTASAAEVFIAALTQNRRAVSIGRPSYGKGVAQRFVDLTDGSALFLTYGVLYPPGGTSFHQQGLNPTYTPAPESGAPEEQSAYMSRVKDLLTVRKP